MHLSSQSVEQSAQAWVIEYDHSRLTARSSSKSGTRFWRPLIGSLITNTERKARSLRRGSLPYKAAEPKTPGTRKPTSPATTVEEGTEQETKTEQKGKFSHQEKTNTKLHAECWALLAKKSKLKHWGEKIMLAKGQRLQGKMERRCSRMRTARNVYRIKRKC